MVWKMIFLFQGARIPRFHVNLRGCTLSETNNSKSLWNSLRLVHLFLWNTTYTYTPQKLTWSNPMKIMSFWGAFGGLFSGGELAVSFRECNRSHPGKRERGSETVWEFESCKSMQGGIAACCLLLVEKKRVSGIPKFTKPHKKSIWVGSDLNLILVSKRYSDIPFFFNSSVVKKKTNPVGLTTEWHFLWGWCTNFFEQARNRESGNNSQKPAAESKKGPKTTQKRTT